MFRIGQKVVCVDASPGRISLRQHLSLGVVYTIRGLDTEDRRSLNLLLEGFADVYVTPWKEPVGWGSWRFRPVVEKKTDISVFTEILRRETIDGSPVVTAPRTRKVSERSERIVP